MVALTMRAYVKLSCFNFLQILFIVVEVFLFFFKLKKKTPSVRLVDNSQLHQFWVYYH